MTSYSPSLRLLGAEVFSRDGMANREVCYANGRFTSDADNTVDLGGYLVMPGIVDLCDSRALSGSCAKALEHSCRMAGITTTLVGRLWDWSAPQPTKCDDSAPLHLICETYAVETLDALTQLIAGGRVAFLSFSNAMHERWRHQTPVFASHFERLHGSDPTVLDQITHKIPRFLCRVAEACDAAAVPYGSLGDFDGETRETFRMIGAQACFAPQARAAAALAGATDTPIVLKADDLLAEKHNPARNRADAILDAGYARAFMSCDNPESLREVAMMLASSGRLDLPAAWALISSRSAEIARLSRKGIIDFGYDADLVILDCQTLQIAGTVVGGSLVWSNEDVSARFGGDHRSVAAE